MQKSISDCTTHWSRWAREAEDHTKSCSWCNGVGVPFVPFVPNGHHGLCDYCLPIFWWLVSNRLMLCHEAQIIWKLDSWTRRWINCSQTAPTDIRYYQSSIAPLWCGGMADSDLGCRADKFVGVVWCYLVIMALRNVSSTLLNLCHEKLRQFCRQKCIQTSTCKV